MEAVVVKQEEGSAAGVAGFGGVSEGRGGGEPSLSSLPLFGESAKPIGDGLSLGSDLSKRREGLEALQEIFARRCKDVLALYQVYQKKWKDDQKDRRSRAHRANLRAKALARESERDKKRSRADQDAAPSTKRKAKRRDSNANANGSLAEAALAENRDLTDREWKKYEQDKGRKLLLIYGLDDWEKIRSQLLEGHKAFCHGVKDIRNFSYTFLLALRNELQKQQQQKQQQEGSAKEGVPSTGTATSAMSVSAKEDAFVKKKLEDMATKGATDVHHLLKEWTKIDKLHVSWVKKLRLLDGLHEAVRLYKDEKTRSQVDQAMTILSEGVLPVEWWTTEADLGLLFGVCKHGYGAYDKIRADPEFEKAFSSRGPIQKQKQSNTNAYRGHPEGCKCVSCYHRRKKEEKAQEEEELRKARKAEIANKAPEEEKDEKKNKEKDGLVGADAADAMDGDDDGGGDWPAVEALTKRLKRIVECMSKVQRKVAKSAVQERKEIEKAREWSKKEKSKLANTVMRWGTPLGEDGEPDWAQLRDLSGLSKKEDASLQTCYYSLVEEANTLRELHAKKLEERRKVSSKEAIAKDQGVEDKKSEAPADDAASDTSGDTIVEEVAHASSLADTSTTQAAGTELVGDVPAETKQVQKVDKEVQQDRKEQVAAKTTLTPITAVRLMERIELMSLLRKMMEDDDWDWNVRHMRELPQWWEPHHDKILIKGILKHGAAQWPFIAQDKELGFPLEREEEKESTNSDTKLDPFPEQKSCVKRCKQIQGAYQRYCNRLQNPPLQKSTKEKRPAVPRKVNKKPKKEEIKVEEKVVAEESISAANDLLQIKIKVSELDHDQLRGSGDGLEEGRSTAKSPKVEVEKEQEKKTVQVRRSKRKR